MNEDEKKYQIALSLIEGVGDVIGKKLLAFTGSAKAVFFAKRKDLEKIDGIGQVLIKAISSADVLAKANGCLLPDYLSGTIPLPQNFASRNRIVAGLSDATIVIESAAKGGSLITADIANSYNREVFAVPGNPTEKNAKGCNYLIKSQQAILLESATDIVKGLNWDVNDLAVQQSIFVDLTDDEQKIIAVLSDNEMHIDSLVQTLNWGFSKLASVLLQAEFKGVIVSLPGKIYKKSR